MTKEEKDYRDICCDMTDQVFALASRVAALAVKRGVPYRLACHAVKVALYQGLFGAVLLDMKNNKRAPSNLKMEEAFVNVSRHEDVANEIFKLAFDHLQTTDRRFVWRMNTMKRKRLPEDP